jgi:rare lipoprotein A (peptidoglycan hydrolase)
LPDQDRYGNSGNTSPLCGKQVEITNTQNGKSVTVIVADDCPTCDNANSIDLSLGAFQHLADLSVGQVDSAFSVIFSIHADRCYPVAWHFVD